MNVLITGASGFVGRALADELIQRGQYSVFGCVRRSKEGLPFQCEVTGDLSEFDRWEEIMIGVDAVVHLAARAHVLHETSVDPLTEFRRVNVDASVAAARAALKAGVKRFVFVSSIGVNGSQTWDKPFTESDTPQPTADYAVSKLDAEHALRSVFAGSSTELVIVRPPLVYDANAPGNFRRLLRLVQKGVPLPFAGVRNQRTMVALENLVDFLVCCLEHPAAADQLFLVADGEAVSLPEMLAMLAKGMGKRSSGLWFFPQVFIALGARIIGKKSVYDQLCGSLVVDITKANRELGWRPKVSTSGAMFKAGLEFLSLNTKEGLN